MVPRQGPPVTVAGAEVRVRKERISYGKVHKQQWRELVSYVYAQNRKGKGARADQEVRAEASRDEEALRTSG
jgi:hypothetical protein